MYAQKILQYAQAFGCIFKEVANGRVLRTRPALPFQKPKPSSNRQNGNYTHFMEYVALGQTDEIGASCHYVKVGETGLVLDCGMHPDRDGMDALPLLDRLTHDPDLFVDHIVITHAHHDHLGALPVLLQKVPHAMVHMTRPTQELSDFLLKASARLQRRRLREGATQEPPLFTEEELEFHSYLFLGHEPETPFSLKGIRTHVPCSGVMYHAGHVLGASSLEVTFTEKGVQRRMLYTGDVHLRAQHLIPAAHFPDSKVDVMILESTLGADPAAEHTTRQLEEERLLKRLVTVLDRGGSALFPVFAFGRAQEMLALLEQWRTSGAIPPDTPIYTAGSMRALAEYYDRFRYHVQRRDPEFEVSRVEQKRMPRSEENIMEALKQGGIFVLPSGMMFERTPSNELAQYLVDDPRHGIFLVGFCKEGSPGERLLSAALKARETGEVGKVVLHPGTGEQEVWCSVDRFRFSGHSNRRELLQVVSHFAPDTVLLVHGEPEAKAWMKEQIEFFHPGTKVVLPKIGVPITL